MHTIRLAWLGTVAAVLGLACGDDGNPGETGGAGQGGDDATTTSSTSAGGSGGEGTSTGTTTSTSSGGGGEATGLSCTDAACDGDDMSCSCSGSCTMCNDIRCFTWDDFVVECVSGIAGITCTCSIDGRLAGNCDDDLLTCSLEEGCCTQYLQP